MIQNQVTALNEFAKSINLDEYDDPKFRVIVSGKEYVANINCYEDLLKLKQLSSDLKTKKIELDSSESLNSHIKSIFPEMPDDAIKSIAYAKKNALLTSSIQFATGLMSASFNDLEIFKRGETQPK